MTRLFTKILPTFYLLTPKILKFEILNHNQFTCISKLLSYLIDLISLVLVRFHKEQHSRFAVRYVFLSESSKEQTFVQMKTHNYTPLSIKQEYARMFCFPGIACRVQADRPH